jgi:hypothetical protein
VATIETENDEDWFEFRTSTKPSLQVQIQFTGLTDGCYNTSFAFFGPTAYDSYSDYIQFNEPKSISRTLKQNTEYGFQVQRGGGGNCTYRLRIDPADAVTVTAPEGNPPGDEGPPATDERGIACNVALRDVDRWTRKFGTTSGNCRRQGVGKPDVGGAIAFRYIARFFGRLRSAPMSTADGPESPPAVRG